MNRKPNLEELPDGPISKLSSIPQLRLEVKNELTKLTEPITHAKNSLLFNEGEPALHFYLIISGGVKLIKKSSSHLQAVHTVLDVLGPGEMIGCALMLDTLTLHQYPISAKTLSPTDVLRFSKHSYHDVWAKSVYLHELFHKSIIKRINCMQKDRCIQKFNLEQRIAYFMSEKWIGTTNTRITRKDIADCIGASPESVIRLLNEWVLKKLISNKNHTIQVRDVEAIRALWKSL